MEREYRVLLIDRDDNVATALEEIPAGGCFSLQGEKIKRIVCVQRIKFGHKVAVKAIKKGSPVVKYGQPIGLATVDIAEGEHVHIHNVESQRGRGDLQ
ncbi:MAG: UxaA family hydrolase [Dethiobacteria bacterium]|jgi:altronate dehydratase small subunit|nr:UxaA family hydrolase [Bacillota bacterium]